MDYCEKNIFEVHCSNGGVFGWVAHNYVLSGIADAVILLAVVVLVSWLIWYVRVYRRRPFCVFCLEEGIHERTTYSYMDQPACWDDLLENLAADEERYVCPKHKQPMEKEIDYDTGVISDVCHEGCVFMDGRELDQKIEDAIEEGRASGMAIGIATGVSIGSNINAGR